MLATVDELIAYMGGVKLTPAQRQMVENVILPGVQQELETYCNRPLEVVHVREERPVDDRGYIVFTKTPVWKINGIWNSQTGSPLPLTTRASTGSNAIPAFTPEPNMRNINHVDLTGEIGLPYEYFVGYSNQNTYYPMVAPIIAGTEAPQYVCDYIAGWHGELEEGLKLDILRVAAREVERMFDDTMSIRGGTQDAAQNSDSRDKGWTYDELYKWDRLRRRVVR